MNYSVVVDDKLLFFRGERLIRELNKVMAGLNTQR